MAANSIQQYASEINVLLQNYTTLLEKASILDPDYETAHAKQLLYTIFKVYMPLIENQFNICRPHLHRIIL